MKIAQLAIIDLSVYRGIHTFTKNLASLKEVDTFYFNPSESNNFESDYSNCVDVSNLDTTSLKARLNEYDVVVLNLNKFIFDVDGIQQRKEEHRKKLIELAKMYCELDTITAFFDHEIYPYEGMHFNTICVPAIITSSDYYLTYTPLFVNELKRYIGMPIDSFDYTFRVGGYIDFSLYNDWIEKSFEIEKNLNYIPECAYYAKFKGHGSFLELIQHIKNAGMDSFGGKKLLHIGNTYSPENYFNHIKVLSEFSNVSRKKFEDMFDENYELISSSVNNYDESKPMILGGTYNMNQMMGLLSKCSFSISPMNTRTDFFGLFISPRFEYAQIEKNFMTLPIYDKSYIDLFESQDLSRLVITYDWRNLEESLQKVFSEMRYLESENGNTEYKERRLKLIEYTKDINKVSNFITDMKQIIEKGIRHVKTKPADDFIYKSLNQLGFKFKSYRNTLAKLQNKKVNQITSKFFSES